MAEEADRIVNDGSKLDFAHLSVGCQKVMKSSMKRGRDFSNAGVREGR